jgi:hypothetical protein
MNWIDLAQNIERWSALVNTAMKTSDWSILITMVQIRGVNSE